MMTSNHPTSRPGILYPHAQWYFLAAIITTWVGFSQSYFMRLRQTTLAHHLHGACMGLWIILLIVEPILYQQGRLVLHKKLGRWGAYGLVPAIILSAAVMVHAELSPVANYPPGAAYPLGALDVYSVLLFAVFVYLAVYFGRQLQLHARYMVCTVLVVLPPALGRAMFFLPFIHTFTQMLNVTYSLMIFILLVLLFDDWRKGRIRAPYAVGLVSFVPMMLAINFANTWETWKRLADWYGSL